MEKILYPDLTRKIIGSAITVLNVLRPGLSEKAYENALVIELRKQGLEAQQQKRFEVHYEGVLVDILVPDLIVNDLVIVDGKVVETFVHTHFSQMAGYLAITNLQLALILNFKHSTLQWRRVLNINKK